MTLLKSHVAPDLLALHLMMQRSEGLMKTVLIYCLIKKKKLNASKTTVFLSLDETNIYISKPAC